MEFIRGSTLDSVDPASLSGRLNEVSFEDIGKMFVLDVLINNFDRIPGNMWNNDGNIGNLMITNDGRIYGIDQGIVSPVNSDAVSNYLAKVASNFEEFKSNPSGCKMVEEIWNFTNSKTGECFTDSDAAKKAISKGIQAVLSKLSALNPQDIIEMKNAIQKGIKVDWENVWVDMCTSVDPQFINQVIKVLTGAGDRGDVKTDE
jgi:hypothetical protein